MTRYLLDVASYQGALKAADVKRAGFSAVNLKVSHGLSRRSVHPDVAGWVEQAKALGLGISTFHYLTADAGGDAQARYAYDRVRELGLSSRSPHQVDVECDPAPDRAQVAAYLDTMTKLLGRPVVVYTGDWWWQPKGWNVSDLTPYLWAAPNAGYLNGYPGDTAPQWKAGYGGWPYLSVMQYAVGPLVFPDGTRGTIDVSKSAIRDERVWVDLSTRKAAMSSWILIPCLVGLRNEFNQVNPNRDKGADGSIGDSSHTSSSDHTPDEDSDVLRDHDPDSKNEVHAVDIDCTGPWPDGKGGQAGAWFDRKVRAIAERERVEYESATMVGRLQYIIWRGQIISRSWGWSEWRAYTGPSDHFDHAHFSGRYLTQTESDERPWGVAEVEDPDMTPDEMTAWAKSPAGKDALYAALNRDAIQRYDENGNPVQPVVDASGNVTDDGKITWASALAYGLRDHQTERKYARDRHTALLNALAAITANVVADDGDKAQILSAIAQARDETITGVLNELGGSTQTDAELAAALVAALGPARAANVAALMGGS